MEVEGLKDRYVYRSYLKEHEKMAIDQIFAADLKEPVYTPELLADKVRGYFEKQDQDVTKQVANTGKIISLDKRKPYTVIGLCNFLMITKATFNKYKADPALKEFHYIAQVAEQIIIEKVLEGALLKEFDSQLSKFYLKNISDLHDDPGHGPGNKVSSVVFITVNDREELKQLKEGGNGFQGEIQDAEVIEEKASAKDK